jgi:hypothetical protein
MRSWLARLRKGCDCCVIFFLIGGAVFIGTVPVAASPSVCINRIAAHHNVSI